jgi:hypothetical protein
MSAALGRPEQAKLPSGDSEGTTCRTWGRT